MSLALADELFLMAHDLQAGTPRVQEPGLGAGLAAALLGELVFAGCIALDDGRLRPGEYGPPSEPLAESLFDQVRNSLYGSSLTIRDWIGERGPTAGGQVGDRLVRAGVLRREVSRRFTRTVVKYLPVKPSDAYLRAQRVPSYLRHRVEVTEADVVVGRIAQIIAPQGSAMELGEEGREYLAQLVPALQQPLQDLLEVMSAFGPSVRGPYF